MDSVCIRSVHFFPDVVKASKPVDGLQLDDITDRASF